MTIQSISLFYNTIRHLKASQIYHQIFNRLEFSTRLSKDFKHGKHYEKLSFKVECVSSQRYFGENQFEFLNQKKIFTNHIDWNFNGFGKLWTYNLEYFDYLNQINISEEEKDRLINDFYNFSVMWGRTLEPYPISLRTINILRFVLRTGRIDSGFLNYVYQELQYLSKHCETHLLGNHLLENGFALIMGGVFFNVKKWEMKGQKILKDQLQEQILNDGGHFELSPMYHCIIFYRLLEMIDWYTNFSQHDLEFLRFCIAVAERMKSWLRGCGFSNGHIPLFNDSANNVAHEPNILLSYSDALEIPDSYIPLGDSGYRSFKGYNFEIKVDFAQVGANYQPGHAHADALSFILYHEGIPIFVEQGTSTYESGKRRDLERSTEAHNTVVVNGKNQSEVWGAFRVGKRAKTTILKDLKEEIEAKHDGYADLGIFHRRNYRFNGNSVQIMDYITGDARSAVAYFHIHPEQHPVVLGDAVKINDSVSCEFRGAQDIQISAYDYADTYNKLQVGKRIVVIFKNTLETKIRFSN